MPNNNDKMQGEDQINQNLKKVYDEVLTEELPDRFKDLLAQLKSQNDDGSDTSK